MKKLEKGFTLIELMIVVAIIAILAAVAAPKFGVQIKKAHDAKGLAVVGALRSAAQMEIGNNVSDSAATTTQSYVDLVTKVDAKSQTLIPSSNATNALVTVGTNTQTTANAGGLTETSTRILLGTPTSDEGLINILSNGKDAKGVTWSSY